MIHFFIVISNDQPSYANVYLIMKQILNEISKKVPDNLLARDLALSVRYEIAIPLRNIFGMKSIITCFLHYSVTVTTHNWSKSIKTFLLHPRLHQISWIIRNAENENMLAR